MFEDRAEAGHRLARALERFRGRKDTVVAGMVRGGVVVAAEVARDLGLPLEAVVVRKIGAPFNPELALGAVAAGGAFLDPAMIAMTGTTGEELERVRARAEAELAARQARFSPEWRPDLFAGRTVLLVDDGLATGASAIAALRAVRAAGAARTVLAVPVAAADSLQAVASEADEVTCLATPEPFQAVGAWYRDFGEVHDADVVSLLPAGSGTPYLT